MKPLSLSLLALTLFIAGCAVGLRGPSDIPITAVAIRATSDAGADAVGAALVEADADVALITGPADSAWIASVAGIAELTVSGPATTAEGTMAFLAGEPVGDSTVVLTYDGGSLTVHDALYEVKDDRFLDLLVFRIGGEAMARPAIAALLQYMATDVMNSAAVVMAVEVPSAAAGDSVARFLSPAYFDALRCEPGLSAPSERSGIRLFYGPEARVYCRASGVDGRAIGDWVRADLVLGRR